MNGVNTTCLFHIGMNGASLTHRSKSCDLEFNATNTRLLTDTIAVNCHYLEPTHFVSLEFMAVRKMQAAATLNWLIYE